MQTISTITSNLINNNLKLDQSHQHLQSLNQCENGTKKTTLNKTLKIFDKFTAAWGNKWSTHYSQSAAQAAVIAKEWTEALTDLTDEQITKAYNYHKLRSEWFPSIAEFRNAALGIMPAGQAWLLVSNKIDGDNALISKAKSLVSSWSWHNKSEAELKREFIDAYELVISRLT